MMSPFNGKQELNKPVFNVIWSILCDPKQFLTPYGVKMPETLSNLNIFWPKKCQLKFRFALLFTFKMTSLQGNFFGISYPFS